VFDE